MLKPVHSQTEPKIKAKRAVLGNAVQVLLNSSTPSTSKNAVTIPKRSVKVYCRIIPPTIKGVTIPKKTIDFIIEEPFTSFRIIASARPENMDNGR